MLWLRRFIRRNTRPIEMAKADRWRKNLSYAYGFFAWNAIAVVAYAMYSGKRDWAAYHGLEVDNARPAVQFSRMMDIPTAKVIRINGFQKTEEYTIDNRVMFDNVKDPVVQE